MKKLELDSNMTVRISPYLVHSFLVIIGDLYFWQIGKKTVEILQDRMKEIKISIIENNRDQANSLAEIFPNISVFNGDRPF